MIYSESSKIPYIYYIFYSFIILSIYLEEFSLDIKHNTNNKT